MMKHIFFLLGLLILAAPAAAQNEYLLKDYSVYPVESPDTADDSSDTEQTFHGYKCSKDCSGHKAGYAWAEKKEITDINDCTGQSLSFSEGCKAYVEEYDEAAKSDPEQEFDESQEFELENEVGQHRFGQ